MMLLHNGSCWKMYLFLREYIAKYLGMKYHDAESRFQIAQ